MFQIMFEHGGTNYVKHCKNVPQKDRYTKKLTDAGKKYEVLGEATPQLCGCIFKVKGTVYTYVRVEGDAEPGNSATVDVVDDHGDVHEEEVIVIYTRETTVDECRKVCKQLGYKKLGRLKKVWQRVI